MSDKPFDLMDDTMAGIDPAPPALTRARRKRALLVKLSIYFAAITFLSGLFFFLYVRFAPLPDGDIANHSRIVAADGSVLTDLFDNGENRIKVGIQDIPLSLQNATVAIEDAQFYNHSGVNLRGIARAMYVDLRQGEWVEGGSSITQQLAKVLFLTHDRTFSRKAKELLLTVQLETRYSKQEILENYLNAIYYGHGAHGVGQAAKIYFNKPVTNLSLAESAMLAGIPKGPTYFSPFVDLDKAKERQLHVLQAMVRNGFITQGEADNAYQQKLIFAEKKEIQTGVAPYFTQFAGKSAVERNGVPEDELFRGGLTLQTTLDLHMQRAAEAAVSKYMPQQSDLQVSLIAMDPKTGQIKAMVGGRDFTQSSFNRVLAKRQPGSSFKPFVYYTALENGATPAKMVKSEPTVFTYENGQTYTVKNFGNLYAQDYIGMREAIKKSDNIYAVQTGMEVTPEKVIQTARRFGIESDLSPYPSLALGVFPVTPLELARAYSVLANGGTLVEPTAIKQIVNPYGRDVYERPVESKQVADAQNIFILTDMMRSVFEPGGTGARIASQLESHVVAGKTGTTDTDAWMAGYSPNLVTVVWVGYDKDRLLNTTESLVAAQVWGEFMKAAQENTPAADFARPEGLIDVNIDPTTGMIATENCPHVQREFFRIGTEPTEECTEHPVTTGQKIEKQIQNGGSAIRKFWDWMRGH